MLTLSALLRRARTVRPPLWWVLAVLAFVVLRPPQEWVLLLIVGLGVALTITVRRVREATGQALGTTGRVWDIAERLAGAVEDRIRETKTSPHPYTCRRRPTGRSRQITPPTGTWKLRPSPMTLGRCCPAWWRCWPPRAYPPTRPRRGATGRGGSAYGFGHPTAARLSPRRPPWAWSRRLRSARHGAEHVHSGAPTPAIVVRRPRYSISVVSDESHDHDAGTPRHRSARADQAAAAPRPVAAFSASR